MHRQTGEDDPVELPPAVAHDRDCRDQKSIWPLQKENPWKQRECVRQKSMYVIADLGIGLCPRLESTTQARNSCRSVEEVYREAHKHGSERATVRNGSYVGKRQ